MLVYEYVDNGNLEQWLHGDVGPVSPLTWDIRMKIAIGTAKGYDIPFTYLMSLRLVNKQGQTCMVFHHLMDSTPPPPPKKNQKIVSKTMEFPVIFCIIISPLSISSILFTYFVSFMMRSTYLWCLFLYQASLFAWRIRTQSCAPWCKIQ